MECRLCGHPSTHKHGKAPNGSQRYFCPHCKIAVSSGSCPFLVIKLLG